MKTPFQQALHTRASRPVEFLPAGQRHRMLRYHQGREEKSPPGQPCDALPAHFLVRQASPVQTNPHKKRYLKKGYLVLNCALKTDVL